MTFSLIELFVESLNLVDTRRCLHVQCEQNKLKAEGFWNQNFSLDSGKPMLWTRRQQGLLEFEWNQLKVGYIWDWIDFEWNFSFSYLELNSAWVSSHHVQTSHAKTQCKYFQWYQRLFILGDMCWEYFQVNWNFFCLNSLRIFERLKVE